MHTGDFGEIKRKRIDSLSLSKHLGFPSKIYGGVLKILRLWRAIPYSPLKNSRVPCTQDLLMWKKLKFLNIEFTW